MDKHGGIWQPCLQGKQFMWMPVYFWIQKTLSGENSALKGQSDKNISGRVVSLADIFNSFKVTGYHKHGLSFAVHVLWEQAIYKKTDHILKVARLLS